jgi:transposase
MRVLSDDLRLRIHEACQDGESTAEVAQRFAVSTAFVRRLKQRFRETGSIAPRRGGRGPAPRIEGRIEELRQSVRDHPDDTPAEHNRRLGLGPSRVTVWRAMRRLGLTSKESPSAPASKTGPT